MSIDITSTNYDNICIIVELLSNSGQDINILMADNNNYSLAYEYKNNEINAHSVNVRIDCAVNFLRINIYPNIMSLELDLRITESLNSDLANSDLKKIFNGQTLGGFEFNKFHVMYTADLGFEPHDDLRAYARVIKYIMDIVLMVSYKQVS